jgi:hypothetical protein
LDVFFYVISLESNLNWVFVEDKRTIIHLSNQIAKIKQNEEWGVAFGVKNLARGEATASQFHYEVTVSDPDVTQKCGIGPNDVESWIRTGRSDDMTISPGESYFGIARFLVPESAPLCTVRFHLDVTKDGVHYATDFFDVEVLA